LHSLDSRSTRVLIVNARLLTHTTRIRRFPRTRRPLFSHTGRGILELFYLGHSLSTVDFSDRNLDVIAFLYVGLFKAKAQPVRRILTICVLQLGAVESPSALAAGT